jgi:D-alanyl-D-alanine carboxypeptidase
VVDGEKIKNQNLLEASLVSSINTAAKMLANELGGEKQVVKNMNQRVKDWGLQKTMFTDSYGYDVGNVGTAREFLTIFIKAATNDVLQKVMGEKSYEYLEVKDLDGKPKHFDNNSNDLANKVNLPFNIVASKTGYLDEAGAGLAMLIERPSDQKRFIVIAMGNPDYDQRFVEPEKLARWALTNF